MFNAFSVSVYKQIYDYIPIILSKTGGKIEQFGFSLLRGLLL